MGNLSGDKYSEERLEALFARLEDLADKIEAYLMKKTTQRSPEWYGGANCWLNILAVSVVAVLKIMLNARLTDGFINTPINGLDGCGINFREGGN